MSEGCVVILRSNATDIYTTMKLNQNAWDIFTYSVSLYLVCHMSQYLNAALFSHLFHRILFIKGWSETFWRTEELKKSSSEMIHLFLAQYPIFSSSNRSCCWGNHGSLVALCSLLLSTPLTSMPDVRIICPCLILLISMLDSTCLNVLLPCFVSWGSSPSLRFQNICHILPYLPVLETTQFTKPPTQAP